MSKFTLRDLLIQIEVDIKKNDFDKALKLYEIINKNWKEFEKNIDEDEAQILIKLAEYIDNLLLEKKKSFFDRKRLFQLRKAYSRF